MLLRLMTKAALITFICATSLAAHAIADDLKRHVNVPPGDLATALQVLAKQSGVEFISYAEQLKGFQTKGVSGTLSALDAAAKLLEDTPLAVTDIDGALLITMPTAPPGSKTPSSLPQSTELRIPSHTSRDDSGKHKPSFWERFRLAQTDQGTAGTTEPSTESTANPRRHIEEIVVTAARREQRAQDFAGGLQVFQGDELDRTGANGFEDYLLSVPGVSLRDQGNGGVRISLRGMSNVGGSDFGALSTVSTVGLYLNEVPIQGTSMMPNLEIYDLSRVEVLKGPQGTLYGEGAMGGAVRMLLNPPDPDAFHSSADATLSGTEEGGLNSRLRGMLNGPLSDSTAVRLVAAYRKDDGFIDNVTTGEEDTNARTGYTVRGLLSSQLTERFSLELLALLDSSEADGFPQMDEVVGDLQVSEPESELADIDTSIFGLTLHYDFGSTSLTSVSSYFDSTQSKQSFQVYPLAPSYPSNVGPTLARSETELTSFAQEVRLVSSGDNRFDWVLGAFYRDKEQDAVVDAVFTNENFAAVNALLAAASQPLLTQLTAGQETPMDEYSQVATYAEGTLELVPRLDLTVGARWFDERVQTFYTFVGADLLAPFSLPGGLDLRGNDSGVIAKIGVSYRTDNDHLLYLLASQGFRSSGPNVIHAFFPTLGEDFVDSDSLWNYEAGLKSDWLDGRLLANVNVFFIDWSEIQGNQTEFEPTVGAELGFQGNAGDAEIKGTELELHARVSDRFQIGTAIGYTDGELTHSNSTALAGVELPNVPEWTASAYAQHRFPLGPGEGILRLDGQYVDSQTTRFITTTDDGGALDSYFLSKLRLGYTSQSGVWGVDFFVDNLGDERAELGRDLAYAGNTSFTGRVSVIQPRTFGVMVRHSL